jgi:DNA-directed RNA polymerase specialized sigma24 family protein
MTSMTEMPENELVAQSLDGNRDAFGRIISRYQSLVSSLAYSATGSLGQSEDLAQETFITAWKHLRDVRETGSTTISAARAASRCATSGRWIVRSGFPRPGATASRSDHQQ